MTVDHLPQSVADLAEPADHAEDATPIGEVNGIPPRTERKPESAPEATAGVDDKWQQSGFGSFP